MTSTLEQRVDHVIAASLKGDGPLTNYFGGLSSQFAQEEEQKNALKSQRGEATLDAEALKARVNARVDAVAQEKIKPLLVAAKSGEGDAGIDTKELSGMAGAVGNTVTAVTTGNPLAMLSAVPLLASFSFIADIVKTVSRVFSGQGIGDAWKEVRSERYVANVATQLSADPDALATALASDPPPPAPAKQNTPPQTGESKEKTPAATTAWHPPLLPPEQASAAANEGKALMGYHPADSDFVGPPSPIRVSAETTATARK